MSNETIDMVRLTPLLHPEEHAELEKRIGRKLSNDEAQELMHELKLWDMFQSYVKNGSGSLR
jgi:hypothetical protein